MNSTLIITFKNKRYDAKKKTTMLKPLALEQRKNIRILKDSNRIGKLPKRFFAGCGYTAMV
jgi:hypothetical protein